jgi:hypothetical protein
MSLKTKYKGKFQIYLIDFFMLINFELNMIL